MSTAATAGTLAHYEQRAAQFWAGTKDHDVRQNVEALLRHLPGVPPHAILDFGCGPGRDLATFRALGHEAVGLEGAPSFAAMAREHSGCEVWEQDFLALLGLHLRPLRLMHDTYSSLVARSCIG